MSARKAAAAGCSRARTRAGFSATAARHRGASAPKRTDARESLINEAVVYTFVVHYTEARAPVPRAHSPLVGEQRRAINLELRDFSPDFDSKMRGNSIDPLTVPKYAIAPRVALHSCPALPMPEKGYATPSVRALANGLARLAACLAHR